MIVRFMITLMVAMAIVNKDVSMSSLSPSTIDLSRKGGMKKEL